MGPERPGDDPGGSAGGAVDPAGTGDAVGPLVGVADLRHPRMDDYRDLNDPAGRRRIEAERGVFVLEGRVAVARALEADVRVRSLVVDDHQVRLAGDLVAAVRARGAPVYVVPRDRLAELVGFRFHRGVVAAADRPADADPDVVAAAASTSRGLGGGPPLVAVLEGLNDPENLGSLFRNAAAFGVRAVLLDPTCGDPLSRRAVRVSVGHVLHVPFARVAPWPEWLERLQAAGFVVCALAPHPDGGVGTDVRLLAERLSRRSPPPVGVALMVGAEGHGLSEAALAAADEVVTIAMAPGVDSLNVATAAAVAFDRLSGPSPG